MCVDSSMYKQKREVCQASQPQRWIGDRYIHSFVADRLDGSMDTATIRRSVRCTKRFDSRVRSFRGGVPSSMFVCMYVQRSL